MQFLMGLNDIHKTARGNILMMNPLPSLNQAYRLILQEKRQREFHSSSYISADSAAFSVNYQYNKPTDGNGNVYQGYKAGNSKGTDGNGNYRSGYGTGQQVTYGIAPNGRRSKYYCIDCKICGHSIERCFKIHGFPTGPKPNVKGKRMANNAVSDSYEHEPGDDITTGDGSSSSNTSSSRAPINQQ